ncbi:MAG TPA: hypothetical protein VKE51_33095 [Vicinamibacterales bacterium]|nr:hypothetical protein [Vicinamibacterales bacterium]
MKRAGIVAVLAMGVVSAIFIEQGTAAGTDLSSTATLSPLTGIDCAVLLGAWLVGVVARRNAQSPAGSKARAAVRWPVRISVDIPYS